ncbi:MAG: hypothetical protein ACSW8B_00435 [bacterium]
MNFVWGTNDMAVPIISIYANNITLNKVACKPFEEVRYVMLGIDQEHHYIGIKPVDKSAIENNLYPQSQLHKITLGKSYGRVTSKSFIQSLIDLIPLDFNKKNCYKFEATYDVIHAILLIDYAKGEYV